MSVGEFVYATGERTSFAPERPWLFAFLIAPMAALSNGLIGGVLSYLLRKQGVGLARGAEIIALLNLPQFHGMFQSHTCYCSMAKGYEHWGARGMPGADVV